jgi:hypothetical protein
MAPLAKRLYGKCLKRKKQGSEFSQGDNEDFSLTRAKCIEVVVTLWVILLSLRHFNG